MKKLFLLVLLNVGLFAIGQTFSFSRLEVYESEKKIKDTVIHAVLKIEEDKVYIEFNKRRFEYEIDDGDGIIYILKDNRKNTHILSLENGLCVIDDRKKIIILKP